MQILKQNDNAREREREREVEERRANERAREKRENVASRNSGSAIKRHYLVTKHNKTSPNEEANDENKQ